MKAATGKYSMRAKNLLKGKLTLFSYTKEVLQVLAERKQQLYANSYIRLVVCELRNNDLIWDAAVEVLERRKKAKQKEDELTESVEELVLTE